MFLIFKTRTYISNRKNIKLASVLGFKDNIINIDNDNDVDHIHFYEKLIDNANNLKIIKTEHNDDLELIIENLHSKELLSDEKIK